MRNHESTRMNTNLPNENDTKGTKPFLPLVFLLVLIGGGVLCFSCQLYETLGFLVGVNIVATVSTWALTTFLLGSVAVKFGMLEKASLKGVLALTLLLSTPLLLLMILFTVVGYAPF